MDAIHDLPVFLVHLRTLDISSSTLFQLRFEPTRLSIEKYWNDNLSSKMTKVSFTVSTLKSECEFT